MAQNTPKATTREDHSIADLLIVAFLGLCGLSFFILLGIF